MRQQARAENGSGTELVCATVIEDIRPAGTGRYRARVFLADRIMPASGSMIQRDANRLLVKGCRVR